MNKTLVVLIETNFVDEDHSILVNLDGQDSMYALAEINEDGVVVPVEWGYETQDEAIEAARIRDEEALKVTDPAVFT